jgi:hypothetical protein
VVETDPGTAKALAMAGEYVYVYIGAADQALRALALFRDAS